MVCGRITGKVRTKLLPLLAFHGNVTLSTKLSNFVPGWMLSKIAPLFLISSSSLPPSLVLNEWFRICIHKLSVQWLALSGPRWRKFSFHCTSSAQTGALFSSTAYVNLVLSAWRRNECCPVSVWLWSWTKAEFPVYQDSIRCTGVTTYCCEQAVPWVLLK